MAKGFSGACVVAKTQEAAHDVLKQSCGLLLNELSDHIAQHSSHSIEALIGGADIVEAIIVKQNLLDDEDGHSFTKLRTSFHDTKTERNDLSRE